MRSKTNLFLLFKKVLTVCIFLVLSYQVNGQTVTIAGPTTVCPNNFIRIRTLAQCTITQQQQNFWDKR